MIKIFVTLLFLIYSTEARENPFFPSEGEVDIPITTNQSQTISPLKRTSITLPSTARTIESVIIRYKNLDGSIDERRQELGNSIDWHIPLFISQNIEIPTKKNKVVEKQYTQIAKLKFISIYEKKNELKIITKDKMIRNFLLTKPHRIVCDFAREIDLRSFEKKIGLDSIVKRIKVGNHTSYYRLVLELDGYYRYSTIKLKDGYFFKFL